jgi:hypothetical protein
MKNIFCAIITLVVSIASGQESKFSYGINVFPNYSIGVPVTSTSAPNIETSIALNSYEKFSFASSIYIECKATKKIHLSIGLGYFNNGVVQKWNYYPQFSQPAPLLSDIESWARTSNHHSIELPLMIKKYFGTRWYGTTGITTTCTLSHTVATTTTYFNGIMENIETSKDTSAPYRTLNLYANLGFGVDYISNDKIALYVQPYAQYGFLGIAKNVPMNYIMFSFGLSTGIRFKK